MRLPLDTEELAGALSRALGPRADRPALTVTEVELVDGAGPGIRLRVTARSDGRPAEAWQVTVPVDRSDLDPDVVPASFVTTVRANVEEWWDLKDHDPAVAAWGRRIV